MDLKLRQKWQAEWESLQDWVDEYIIKRPELRALRPSGRGIPKFPKKTKPKAKKKK
jgi:hypothetical protein